MKKYLALILLSALAAAPTPVMSQDDGAGETVPAIISVPLANVRQSAEPKSPIITQVLLADEVRIIEKNSYRYRIAIPSQGGREGWVHQEAVLIPRDQGAVYLKPDRRWIIIRAPKTPALILEKTGNHHISLYGGTRLPVVETTPDGHKVQFPDRTLAVIPAEDAMPFVPDHPLFSNVNPSELAETARRFLNVRYLAGGVTAQGMDTRGLLHIVYRIHGILLDTDRAGLGSRAEKISKKDLLPGDILVFYGEGYGLYLGNGRFVHAVKKSSIQVGGIYDKRYANSLQHGLRIVGAEPQNLKKLPEMSADEILTIQAAIAELPLGRRIAFWAERFIGTPYDTDPLGLYVRTSRIIADEEVDCMYHTFRSAELALTDSPRAAFEKALELRFLHQGRVQDGLVLNYEDRYQYGEDMVFSTKWGRNVTAELGPVRTIPGSRGRDTVDILPKESLVTKKVQKGLEDGDIIFWIKDPKKRVVGEIVAHLSIVRIKSGRPMIIHAAGSKSQWKTANGGVVKEVPFADYVRDMRFIGAFITRFEQ